MQKATVINFFVMIREDSRYGDNPMLYLYIKEDVVFPDPMTDFPDDAVVIDNVLGKYDIIDPPFCFELMQYKDDVQVEIDFSNMDTEEKFVSLIYDKLDVLCFQVCMLVDKATGDCYVRFPDMYPGYAISIGDEQVREVMHAAFLDK